MSEFVKSDGIPYYRMESLSLKLEIYRLTAQLAERDAIVEDIEKSYFRIVDKYNARADQILTLQTENTALRGEVERLKQLKIIGDLTNMLAEARKQTAQECMQICDDVDAEGYYYEINNHAVVKDRIAAKFGLEE